MQDGVLHLNVSQTFTLRDRSGIQVSDSESVQGCPRPQGPALTTSSGDLHPPDKSVLGTDIYRKYLHTEKMR